MEMLIIMCLIQKNALGFLGDDYFFFFETNLRKRCYKNFFLAKRKKLEEPRGNPNSCEGFTPVAHRGMTQRKSFFLKHGVQNKNTLRLARLLLLLSR